MSYSDLQLKNATQVAYKDFQVPFQQLVDAGQQPPFTIEKLCAQMVTDKHPTADDVYRSLFPDLDGQNIRGWEIVDFYDTNKGTANDTGFYGCVIDVGDGDAIIAFRGSEGALDLSNLQHDWIEADLGLLNSTLTIQQGEVYKFLKAISESDYIKEYDSLAMTGHSLGGNLAEHGAIVSADPEINLHNKLKRCVNYDGPGYSDEYLTKNADLIEKVKDKITHYRWSPVGGLLFEIPGNPRISLEFSEKNDFLYNLIARHSTESIIFIGEDAKRGEITTWDILTSKFSQGIDHMPKVVGDVLVGTVSGLLYGGIWMYNEMFEKGKLTEFGEQVVVAAVAFVITVGPIKTISLVTTILFVAVISFFAVVAFEFVYEGIERVVNFVVEKVTQICTWLTDKVQELKEFVANGLKELEKWLNSKLKSLSNANPIPQQIKLDTYKLTTYASRISNVNRRINTLDRRLDNLYWQVGLQGLWNLLQADLLTGYSWRLNRCASYLNTTASNFNTVENKLRSSL